MTQQGVRWTTDQVLALAPDAASRKAGSKLGAAGPWSETGSSDEGAVWGLCKGSGSKPYQTIVDTGGGPAGTGTAYKCTCPSRKFPCKHALGLLLLWASGATQVPTAQAPDWTEQWLENRKNRAAQKRTEATAPDSAGGPADPEAARRRAERRAQRVTAGVTELEQRLTDLLRGGLAQAEQAGYGLWEETAARMVDAQAPGLAARVRELGAIPASGPGWPMRLLEECALIHLLNKGWQHQSALPEPLATTVRSRIGLPATPPTQPPLRDSWLILSQYDRTDGHLTTRRIWLHGTESDRTALLLSFGAAGRAPSLALPPGLTIDAELKTHPGATHRADLTTHHGTPPQPPSPLGTHSPTGVDVHTALTAYGQALTADPWLDSWPVTLAEVIPTRTPDGTGWQLADAAGKYALPLTPRAPTPTPTPLPPNLWRLIALSGGAPVTVFGECGHAGFHPLSTWTQKNPEIIPLT
ncbi:SWIM zinc finger domain-containing protein [Streptomyces kunmingensis]|uniref:SWIM zinc finger domain-containing protein n=1 Tax=Streptomyces kunmingensis TaxID=68225 RepID=A0ABU6CRA9_9ACTN|nr:SWIM zinc finger family protein [Streptomyces kunmingensis]MEB3966470.1 SWIM zinc finger domain-containing protein [Streptomyces kunmingensis]